MSVLGNFPAIEVSGNLAMILGADSRIRQILNIISYGHDDLICDNTFLHHIEDMLIDHFPYDDS